MYISEKRKISKYMEENKETMFYSWRKVGTADNYGDNGDKKLVFDYIKPKYKLRNSIEGKERVIIGKEFISAAVHAHKQIITKVGYHENTMDNRYQVFPFVFLVGKKDDVICDAVHIPHLSGGCGSMAKIPEGHLNKGMYELLKQGLDIAGFMRISAWKTSKGGDGRYIGKEGFVGYEIDSISRLVRKNNRFVFISVGNETIAIQEYDREKGIIPTAYDVLL